MVSGFGWSGAPKQLVDLALDGRFLPVTSPEMLAELDRVLRYEHLRVRFPEPESIVRLWNETAVVVVPTVVYELVEGDNHVLAAAEASAADYIVTGDKALLSLRQLGPIPVVSVETFLSLDAMAPLSTS